MASSLHDRPPNVNGYEILHQIGKGSYSVVFKAQQLESDEEVAIKCILKSSLSPSRKNNIVTEIQIMKMLKNPFILNMRDFQYDEEYVYIILDYCDGGDLSRLIKSKKKLSEKICQKFMQQLVLGLKFLRSKNITHFDLKPQNLLLVTKPTLSLKIGDFGLSSFLSEKAHSEVLKGSPLYMAPEILLGKPADPKADLWSVGVIFYECLFGQAPLAHSNCRQLVKLLSSEAPINIPKGLSIDAQDLLTRLLVINPKDRIAFEELFAHPFLDLDHYPSEESYAKAVSLARKAVLLDFEKKYLEAFNMYSLSLSYLVPFLQSPLTPEREEFIRKKVNEYINRAEQLKTVLYKAKTYLGNHSQKLSNGSGQFQRSAQPKAQPSKSSAQVQIVDDTYVPNRSLNQLSIDQQKLNVEEAAVDQGETLDEIDINALKAMCNTTPKLADAIDIGIAAQMYLYEGQYPLALEKYKLSLNILVPLLALEPPGKRRSLLIKLTREWIKEAESSEALFAAHEKSTTDMLASQAEESCVIQ